MRVPIPAPYERAVLTKIENLRIKSYTDPYVLRLQQVVTGMLTPGNLYAWEYVFSRLTSPSPVVEIGAFCGLSTNLITYFKRRHNRANRFVTCDRWDYAFKGLGDAPLVPGTSVTGADFGRFARETFIRNTMLWSRDDLPSAIEISSGELFVAWERAAQCRDLFDRSVQLGGPISFCFIDGNHEYEAVKADFEHTDRFLERGGWILFDDSADLSGSPGTRRLMKELRVTGVFGGSYEVVLKNPHYLVRKR